VTSPIDISAPCQLICEGAADEAFFTKLLNVRSITGFQVRCARSNKEPKKCAGKSGIADTMSAILSANDLRPDTIKGILVAVDSDDDPETEFADAIEQVRLSRPMLHTPDRIMEIKELLGGISIAIMTIPWLDQPGNLDTLLFQSIDITHADIMQPLSEYCKGTENRTRDWSIGKRSKMKLRCAIAASHKPDPSLALPYLIAGRHCPFDFSDERFNNIAAYIGKFRQTVNP